MADDYGKLPKMEAISQLVVSELETALGPINIFLDVVNDVASQGDSVTVHLYERATAPESQNVSGGGTIDYTTYESDVSLTPVNVPLAYYQANGFDLAENILQRSPAKDIFSKFAKYKTYELAKAISSAVIAKIDSSYTQTVSVTGDLTYETVAKTIVPKCGGLGIMPQDAALVIDWSSYGTLLNSLPSLSGVMVNDEMRSGVLKNVAGFGNIYATDQVPSGTHGFVADRNAMAVAIRPLPLLTSNRTYGYSTIGEAESGLSVRIREWQDPSNPAMTFVMDTIWGASPFDKNALIRLTT